MTKPRIVLRCIVREGALVGYRMYRRGAIFGGLSFYGYCWL